MYMRSTMDTLFPADSLEFCPLQGVQNIFVCGTYKLDEHPDNPGEALPSSQRRRGQCLVFRTDNEEESFAHQIQTIDLPAVLDMKWCHQAYASNAVLGIADSEGNITLHNWDNVDMCLIQCAASDVLCLSLDWSNRRMASSEPGSLIVSLSNGSLCLLKPDIVRGLAVAETWHAHDFEPWIAAWDSWDPNIIYSGGDDLKLKAWDTRQKFSSPIFINKRFDAGVTSIQSHPHIEHVLAVGSYNGTVQLFDNRRPLVPLMDAAVGGGAWRVKWHPSADRKHDLLVACMHDGFKIVHFDLSTPGIGQVTKRFDKHSSLGYGVDWSYAPALKHKETLIGSCSFYDHTLHLWTG